MPAATIHFIARLGSELKVAITSGCFILETGEIEPEFIAAGNAGDVRAVRGGLRRHSSKRQRFARVIFSAGHHEGRTAENRQPGFVA
jgi:hypothetical protein